MKMKVMRCTLMELLMSLLLMLGGVAVFMYGMKQMSLSMEQGAGAGVHKLFKKISKNRLLDYGIGIGATAIVQSSSATSIMTVGLANAGIVEVKNGAGMILGAKVGTTLTAFVFALSGISKGGFSVSAVFASLAFVGVIIIYTSSNESLNKLALFLTGFGMLFAGMELMEMAIGGSDSILSLQLQNLFQYDIMYNPICLVILGVLFTAIIQSSTAATGLFLIFLTTGVIATIDQSFFLIMGANIGTCTDGLMASIGTNANGKRIAFFHVLTSVLGAIAFTIILIIFRTPIVNLFNNMFPDSPHWSLATFNLIYNVVYTLILLALLTPLVNFVKHVIKEQDTKAAKVSFIDDRLLSTPIVAINNACKEVSYMATLAQENVTLSFTGLIDEDTSQSKLIATTEDTLDSLTKSLAEYFIKISSSTLTYENGKLVGGLHHVINDIERIGDYAVILAKETNYMKKNDAHFMSETKDELKQIYNKISEIFELSLFSFKTRKTDHLQEISDIQIDIKNAIHESRDVHAERLGKNMYSIEVSKSLYSVLFALQRISDHLVNVAFSIRSETGSKTEAWENIKRDEQR